MLRQIFLALIIVSASPATGQNSAAPTDESSIRKILSKQEQAWNMGDGAGWAKPFTEDSDFVNIRGDVFHGRNEIAARHTAILAGPFKGSHVVITVRHFRSLSPEIALIETDQEVTGFQKLMPGIAATAEGLLKTHMKYVALKQDGEWHFVAAQNTSVLPPLKN